MVSTEAYVEVGGDVDVAAAATLFADRTRAAILSALADGRALAASVLADEAGVSAPAASAALAKLAKAGLIGVEVSGRHRYYHLASDQVATVIEALSGLAPPLPVRSLREGTRAAALRRARTCYDPVLAELGVDLDAVRLGGGQRPLLRVCLDWSEQRHHLSGRLGAAMLDAFLDQRWVERRTSHRAVTVTDAGVAALRALAG